MTCNMCAHASEHGHWPDTSVTHCLGCHRTWSGKAEAHCAACHMSFAGVTAFDAHQKASGCIPEAEFANQRTEAGELRWRTIDRKGGKTYVRNDPRTFGTKPRKVLVWE